MLEPNRPTANDDDAADGAIDPIPAEGECVRTLGRVARLLARADGLCTAGCGADTKPAGVPGTDSPGDLVRAALRGEALAMNALTVFLGPLAFGAAYQMTRNDATAEDLGQEALHVALENLASLRDPDRIVRWTRKITRRLALNFMRRRYEVLWSPDALTEHVGGASGPEASFEPRLEPALESLPEEQRVAFVLREVQGLTWPQIGQLQGVPRGTAQSRARLACETLREALGVYGDTSDGGDESRDPTSKPIK